MPKQTGRVRIALSIAAVIAIVVGLFRFALVGTVAADTMQATGALKWYRGNLHTHSHWSDGDDYLESIAVWYRDRGYEFLAFTDHNVLPNTERWVEIDKTKGNRIAFNKLKELFPDDWVEVRTRDEKEEVRLKRFDEVAARISQPGKFLLIQSEEISDDFETRPIHLNAHNLVEPISPRHGTSVSDVIQNNVDAALAQRERTSQPIMIHLNHPNFGWGVTAEDLAPIRGENFFEVYNGHPDVANDGDAIHASTERMWDIINTRRLTEYHLPLLFGLATDDGHQYHNIPSRSAEPGRGWVMVLSDALTPAALIRALEAGRFYATCGVTLEKVSVTSSSLEIQVRPDENATYQIEFIGTRKGFDSRSEPIRNQNGKNLRVTRKYSHDIGKVLKTVTGTSATYHFTGTELYVRAKVTSSRPHPNPAAVGEYERAWTQPVQP